VFTASGTYPWLFVTQIFHKQTIIYKTLHREVKIEQYQPHETMG